MKPRATQEAAKIHLQTVIMNSRRGSRCWNLLRPIHLILALHNVMPPLSPLPTPQPPPACPLQPVPPSNFRLSLPPQPRLRCRRSHFRVSRMRSRPAPLATTLQLGFCPLQHPNHQASTRLLQRRAALRVLLRPWVLSPLSRAPESSSLPCLLHWLRLFTCSRAECVGLGDFVKHVL